MNEAPHQLLLEAYELAFWHEAEKSWVRWLVTTGAPCSQYVAFATLWACCACTAGGAAGMVYDINLLLSIRKISFWYHYIPVLNQYWGWCCIFCILISVNFVSQLSTRYGRKSYGKEGRLGWQRGSFWNKVFLGYRITYQEQRILTLVQVSLHMSCWSLPYNQ